MATRAAGDSAAGCGCERLDGGGCEPCPEGWEERLAERQRRLEAAQ